MSKVIEISPDVMALFPKNEAERRLIRQYREMCSHAARTGKEQKLLVTVNRMRGDGLSSRLFDIHQVSSMTFTHDGQ